MIDAFPDFYRVSTDDGETTDYTLNGVISLDTGDEFVFQPDTTDAETVGDSRLPLGKVTMVTTRQGDVYLLPSNRLADAQPITEAELVRLAVDYLACAPFVTPFPAPTTKEQVAAMRMLLGVSTEMAVEAPVSPVAPAQPLDPSASAVVLDDGDDGVDTSPNADADEVVESPKAGAPATDQSPSASPEPASPSRKRKPASQPESLDLSQPVSPDPESLSPRDDSPAATIDTAGTDGPVERVKATETLKVDTEPDESAPDRMTITIDSGTLSGTLGASPESSSPLVINVEDDPTE